MRAIFVSYRRDDSEGEAGRLFDDLVGHFGEDSVFMDVAAIEVGRDFRKAIDESVATCGVLLAVIGKEWTDAKNEAGQRRLDDPFDFVRLETASALKRDIPVIPVLVHGAKMPRADQLPDDLKELAYRNGVEVTHARWNSDLQLLIKALRPHVEDRKSALAGSTPTLPEPATLIKPAVRVENKVVAETSPPAPRKPLGIIFAIVATVLVAGAGVGYMLMPKQVTVPDLSGSTLSDAATRLQALNLAVGQKSQKEDSTKAPNLVISQSPSPNARVKAGSTVDLVISQAPTAVAVPLVEIPPLVGKSLEDARRALADQQLQVGNVVREPKAGVAADTVLQEFPVAGQKAKAGSNVDLMVSDVQASASASVNTAADDKAFAQKMAAQRAAAQKAADQKALADKAASDKAAADQKALADKAAADRTAAEKALAEQKALADKAAADKAAADQKALADKAAADRAAAEKALAEQKALADKAAADKAAADKATADKAAADKSATKHSSMGALLGGLAGGAIAGATGASSANTGRSEQVSRVPLVPAGELWIMNVNSGLCLSPAGGSNGRNVQIVQFACDQDRSRLWRFTVVDGDVVQIRNSYSDLCLTIAGGSADRNVAAVQYPCDSDPSRRWRYSPVDRATFRLMNVNSHLCLTVAGGGTTRNATAVQYACDGDPSRDWKVMRPH